MALKWDVSQNLNLQIFFFLEVGASLESDALLLIQGMVVGLQVIWSKAITAS